MAPRVRASDYVWVDPDEPADHGSVVAVRDPGHGGGAAQPGVPRGLRHRHRRSRYGVRRGRRAHVGHGATCSPEEGGRVAVEALLRKRPGIDVVYAINEPAAGAHAALEARGLDNDVLIVSVDGGDVRGQERCRRRARRNRHARSSRDGLSRGRGGRCVRPHRQKAAVHARCGFPRHGNDPGHRCAGSRHRVHLHRVRLGAMLGTMFLRSAPGAAMC